MNVKQHLALPFLALAFLVGTLGPVWSQAQAVTAQVVCHGDSLTHGYGASSGLGTATGTTYPGVLARALGPTWRVTSLGTGGWPLGALIGEAPQKVDPLFDPHLAQNVLIIFGGTNDLGGGHESAGTAFGKLVAYCRARKAAHAWRILVVTPSVAAYPNVYPADFDAQMVQYDSDIRRDWPLFADGIVDVGADPRLGTPGAERNPTYFTKDFTHLTDAGYAIVGQLAADAVLHPAPAVIAAQEDAASTLPTPWKSSDVGEGTLPGTSTFENGTFGVSGAGGDIQDHADGFRFVSQPMRGDMVLTAHIASLSNTDPWAKAGLMLREGLDAGAKNALLAVTSGHGVAIQHRDSAGEATATEETPDVIAPVWLQMRRAGSTVTAFQSADGKNWTPVGSPVSVPLGATVLAGLAMTSHDPGTQGEAVFDHVTLAAQKPQAADPRDLVVTVSTVEPGIFHLVAYRKGNAPPPASPFVVETRKMQGLSPTHLQTTQATLDVSPNHGLRLRDAAGRDLLPSGTVGVSGDTIVLTLAHGTHERFYGAGNESENHAGDLTHPSGTQIVSNGVTRIPFLWSTGGWSALVANNQSGTSWNDDSGTLTWTVPGPYLDLYLSVAPNGYGLLNAYSRLSGRAPIPPRWTFGFMLSRWGYADASDVQDKWQQFRDRQIPVDSFEYDYDWFVNDWDFNPKTFPPGSLAKMKRMGLHFVGIRKPRVTGANLDYARRQGWVLSSPLGTDLRFDLPVARYWWWSHHVPLVQAGVAGWWNDEAEQSADEFFQMTQAEWEGGRVASPRRVWSISRAFAPGMQRFGAAAWTGDIDSSWATLANQPGTMLNWSLAGMPYVGQDIGGFQSTPTPELYARWIEEGVFVPVMRAHGTFNSPRWPWAFGDDVLAATKKAIELRYRLIPYFYTFASQTASMGTPLMRPLFLEFPKDPKTFNLGDEWLVGDRLLAAPVLTQGGARDVYLPAGRWYDFNTSAAITGGQTLHVQAPLDLIPAYVRAGTILPLGPVLQSTSLGAEDPLEVRVYPGADAAFTLYEDDGDTYAYQHGAASHIPMRWNDRTKTLTVGLRTGSYPGMTPTRHLVVLLPGGAHKSVTYVGRPIQVHF